MKKLTAFIVFTLLFSPMVWAADQSSHDALSLPQAGTLSSPLRLETNYMVRDAKLIAKPGAIFSEGYEGPGVELPYLISTPQPIAYPRVALRKGWEGRTVIAIEVLPTGDVGRFQIMKSSGHEPLDEAAARAVKSWKFQPAMKNGKPMNVCVQIPVSFEIQN